MRDNSWNTMTHRWIWGFYCCLDLLLLFWDFCCYRTPWDIHSFLFWIFYSCFGTSSPFDMRYSLLCEHWTGAFEATNTIFLIKLIGGLEFRHPEFYIQFFSFNIFSLSFRFVLKSPLEYLDRLLIQYIFFSVRLLLSFFIVINLSFYI